jgi:hypothetical protein
MAKYRCDYRRFRWQRPGVTGGYYLDLIAEVSLAAGLDPMDVAELPLPMFLALQKALHKRAEEYKNG